MNLLNIHQISLRLTAVALVGLTVPESVNAASVINFETLPDGVTTPTDNAALTVPYIDNNGTIVIFGFDTDNDLNINLDAVLESRTDGFTGIAYTVRGLPDLDLTAMGEGGDWLLRAPSGINFFDNISNRTTADFIIQYMGMRPTSASGQLWDIDGGESYLIEALDVSGVLISSLTTPTVPGDGGPGTFNGLPFTFSFEDLASEIGFIRISGLDRISGGGFAFDNFNATAAAQVPEPGALGALALLSLGSWFVKKKQT